MKSVVLALLTVSLTAGLLQAIGAHGSFEKYLRYVSALLLTLVLLSPLEGLKNGELSFSGLLWKDDLPVTEAVPEEYLRRFEQEVERAVSDLLEKEFSLQIDEVRPIASAEDENGVAVLCHLEIRLYTPRGAMLTGKIRKCLKEAVGCRVTIVEDVRW